MEKEKLIELGVPEDIVQRVIDEMEGTTEQQNADLQAQLDEANKKLADMEYTGAINELLKKYTFTSPFIRESVTTYLRGLELPLVDGVIVGAEEQLEQLIKDNNGLVKSDRKMPMFSSGSSGASATPIDGVEEKFYSKNPNLRRER